MTDNGYKSEENSVLLITIYTINSAFNQFVYNNTYIICICIAACVLISMKNRFKMYTN